MCKLHQITSFYFFEQGRGQKRGFCFSVFFFQKTKPHYFSYWQHELYSETWYFKEHLILRFFFHFCPRAQFCWLVAEGYVSYVSVSLDTWCTFTTAQYYGPQKSNVHTSNFLSIFSAPQWILNTTVWLLIGISQGVNYNINIQLLFISNQVICIMDGKCLIWFMYHFRKKNIINILKYYFYN